MRIDKSFQPSEQLIMDVQKYLSGDKLALTIIEEYKLNQSQWGMARQVVFMKLEEQRIFIPKDQQTYEIYDTEKPIISPEDFHKTKLMNPWKYNENDAW